MTTTTNTAQGLLADILEHPEADDLRLIYADWLDDHGEEERAEFIRVQVEELVIHTCKCAPSLFASPRCSVCEQVKPLRKRANHLVCELADIFRPQVLYSWGVSLFLPTKDTPCSIVRRGFVAEVHAPLAVLMQHLPALVRQHPIERVRATDKEPEFFEDLSNPWTWWRHGDRAGSIGSGLWAKLDGHVVDAVDSVSSGKDYPTAEAAHDALSVALLKLARG